MLIKINGVLQDYPLDVIRAKYIESIGIPSTWVDDAINEKETEDVLLAKAVNTLLRAITKFCDRDDNYFEASNLIKEIINKFYKDEAINLAKVNHPKHYNIGEIETIELYKAFGIHEPFCLGNSIKYLSRYKYNGKPVEDLSKALWYIEYLIK